MAYESAHISQTYASSGEMETQRERFIADTIDDMLTIPCNNLGMGSQCHIITTGVTYELTSERVWVNQSDTSDTKEGYIKPAPEPGPGPDPEPGERDTLQLYSLLGTKAGVGTTASLIRGEATGANLPLGFKCEHLIYGGAQEVSGYNAAYALTPSDEVSVTMTKSGGSDPYIQPITSQPSLVLPAVTLPGTASDCTYRIDYYDADNVKIGNSDWYRLGLCALIDNTQAVGYGITYTMSLLDAGTLTVDHIYTAADASGNSLVTLRVDVESSDDSSYQAVMIGDSEIGHEVQTTEVTGSGSAPVYYEISAMVNSDSEIAEVLIYVGDLTVIGATA